MELMAFYGAIKTHVYISIYTINVYQFTYSITLVFADYNLTLARSEVWGLGSGGCGTTFILKNRRALRLNIQTHTQTKIFVIGSQRIWTHQDGKYALLYSSFLFIRFLFSHYTLQTKGRHRTRLNRNDTRFRFEIQNDPGVPAWLNYLVIHHSSSVGQRSQNTLRNWWWDVAPETVRMKKWVLPSSSCDYKWIL